MKFPLYFEVRSKILSLILVLFFIGFKSFSQEKKSNYNLLWQISGNGLTKPSYLFGSMHVKDKRAFNFSDSLINAIESSSGFVLEVHPDSLMKSFFAANVERTGKKKITELITAEQIAELVKRFEAKNGFAPDSAMLDNPILVASLMKNHINRKDDMQTFVDAHLYGIARILKKKIYGLEKPEDQVKLLYGSDAKIAGLFDIDEEAAAEDIEKMVEVYAKGDLNGITGLLSEETEDQLDLVNRNEVMATGIMKLMQTDNLFAVVGASHIAGEKGIIALLKKAGYSLRPVTATFTGVAKKFKVDYAKMDWVKHKDVSENFEVEFPAEPIITKAIIGKSYVSADIITNMHYAVQSSYTGPLEKMTSKQYLDTVLSKYLKKDMKLVSKKSENRYGGVGLAVELEKEGKFSRSVLVHKNYTLYMISAEAEKNNLHETYVDKFFSTFKISDAVTAKNGNWLDYKNDLAGFSLKIPMQPEESTKEIPNPTLPAHPYVMNLYTMLDKVNFVSYLFRYNDFPEGMYLSDKNTFFNGIKSQLEKNGKIVDGPVTIYKDGLEGREIGIVLQGTYMKVQMFLRGNRSYLLMKQNQMGEDKMKDDEYFSSFKVEKYVEGKSDFYNVDDLKVFTPAQPSTAPEKDEVDHTSFLSDNKLFYSRNKNTGGAYLIGTSKINKYFKTTDLDSLYITTINRMKKETDSIIKTEDVVVGTSKAKVFTYVDSASGLQKKAKFWINGERFYYLNLMSTKEDLDSKQALDFFNTVSVTTTPKPFDIKASKAKLIFDHLKSKDTLVYNPAFGALAYYEFDKTEIPLINAALRIKYADDTLTNGVRVKLIKELSALQKEKSIPLLKELFADVKNTSIVRNQALTEVVRLDSNQYDWYLKSLTDNKALELESYWSTFRALTDSLAYVSKHFDQVLSLKNKEPYRSSVLGLISEMVSSEKPAYLAQVKQNKDKITAQAMLDLDGYFKDNDNYPGGSIYSYLEILPALDMPEFTNAFTSKLVTDSNTYLATSATVARIKAGLAVDQKLIDAKLDSLSSRYDILMAFDAVKKLDQVPAKYLKHEEIAKLLLTNYMSEELDYSEKVQLLDKIEENGKTYYAFEFIYPREEEGESTTYVGVCGPFESDNKQINFKQYKCNSDFEVKSDDWLKQVKTLITGLTEE
ncbi:TraB/GumN family protein [Pedobacter ghigonis]|uniref:TraB/GumN family protein n=1 Tax=Pedobacter ghigonis TaxID=2730403 RepID=UPI00158C6B6E|nr:TraB/GumN family protein [Pedobacter ghigonis]